MKQMADGYALYIKTFKLYYQEWKREVMPEYQSNRKKNRNKKVESKGITRYTCLLKSVLTHIFMIVNF